MTAKRAPYGIRVDAYSPGIVPTLMTKPKLEKHESTMLEAISLDRSGNADEVANVVLFLASSASAYVISINVDVSGDTLNIFSESTVHVVPMAELVPLLR